MGYARRCDYRDRACCTHDPPAIEIIVPNDVVASKPRCMCSAAASYIVHVHHLSPYAGAVAEEYQDNITRLSKKHNGPIFQPHVTLLAGTQQTEHDAIQRAETLAHALTPQEVQLKELSFGSTFHQCIYIRCQQQPELLEAAKASQDAFGEPPTSFTPHLSLLYSDVSESERMQIVSDVAAERGPNKSWPAFRMDRIHLWSTEADDRSLSSWTLVKSFDLQK